MWSIIGLSFIGTKGFGRTFVNGFKRVPFPPAIITTFIFNFLSIFFLDLKNDCHNKTFFTILFLLTTGIKSYLSFKKAFFIFELLYFPSIKYFEFLLQKFITFFCILFFFSIAFLTSPSLNVPSR